MCMWYIFLNFHLLRLTDSDPAAVTNSCRARTESACSMTNVHCERSGGTFLSAMFSRKQCRLPNPSAARHTRSPVAVHERHTMSSCKNRIFIKTLNPHPILTIFFHHPYRAQEWNIILLRSSAIFGHYLSVSLRVGFVSFVLSVVDVVADVVAEHHTFLRCLDVSILLSF